MVSIDVISISEAIVVHDLVHQIYFPTYKEILTKDQIEFMLDKSYTVSAIAEAIQQGQNFYVLREYGIAKGFMSLQQKDSDILLIEKLYLLPETQGKGYGRNFISFAVEEAVRRNKSILELNVNRRNKAYYFYLKVGFKVTQEVDIPYFGYVLDDYVMQKQLKEP